MFKHESGCPVTEMGEIPSQPTPGESKHLRVTQIWSSCADFSSCFAFIALMAKTNFFLCSGCFIPISWNKNTLTKGLPRLWLLSSCEVTLKIDTVDFRKVEPMVWRDLVGTESAVITFSMSWGVAVNSVWPDVTHCRAKITYWPRPKSSSQLQTLSVLHWAKGALWSLKSTRNIGKTLKERRNVYIGKLRVCQRQQICWCAGFWGVLGIWQLNHNLWTAAGQIRISHLLFEKREKGVAESSSLCRWGGNYYPCSLTRWNFWHSTRQLQLAAGGAQAGDDFCYQGNSFQLLWNSTWTEMLGQSPQEEGLAAGHI